MPSVARSELDCAARLAREAAFAEGMGGYTQCTRTPDGRNRPNANNNPRKFKV